MDDVSRLSAMCASMGVVLLRGAFDPTAIAGLREQVEIFTNAVVEADRAMVEPDLPPHLLFNPKSKSVHLRGLDPTTADRARDAQGAGVDGETSILKALRDGPHWDVFEAVCRRPGLALDWRGGRVRAGLIDSARVGSAKGAVGLHQERWALRDRDKDPGHNVWLCLNRTGDVANQTTTGLQFLIDDPEFWRSADVGAPDGYAEVYQPRLSRLNGLAWRHRGSSGEFARVDDQILYRPLMQVGDALLFDHYIPHGTYAPPGVENVRMSCEFRIYHKAAAA